MLAARLPQQTLGLLQGSTPCPAYHPDTLTWLLRRGDSGLVKQILESLLRVLGGVQPLGVQPYLDVPLDDLHSGSEGGLASASTHTPAVAETDKPGGGDTADALFGGDDDALSRMRQRWQDSDSEPEEALADAGPSAAVAADVRTWHLPATDADQLSMYLQIKPLPLVSSHEQALLMILLQEVGAGACASDLDECGQRYMQSFEVHVAVHRRHVGFGGGGDQAAFLQHLSSEDLCWALHSDCQGTIVDKLMASLGADLDWPRLRMAGVGLWLTDMVAMKNILEVLPRSILKKQGQDLNPEAVALWYALLGRRTLLAALYRQAKNTRVADFLAQDLSEEPWRTKAEKNAFELLRQKRFELACAFFVLAKVPHNAVDVCVRYMADWSLGLLIAQHVRHSGSAECQVEAEAELQRVLMEDLHPLASDAGDPWLDSLAYWHAAKYDCAMQSVLPPYRAPLCTLASAASKQLFSGGHLRHGGASPGLPRFVEVLRAALAKRRIPEPSCDGEALAVTAMGLVARSYLARRQPLLALPPGLAGPRLPWRAALGVSRALASLSCAGQPLVRGDGSTVLDAMGAALCQRTGLPAAVVQAVLFDACSDSALEATVDEPWAAFLDVAPFYSPSSAPSPALAPPPGAQLEQEQLAQLPPYLHPYVGHDAAWVGTPELEEEVGWCRSLRRLGTTHAARALSSDEHGARVAALAAIAWRALPRLRSYLLDPAGAPLPVPVLHLLVHLLCAPCVSRPPPPMFPPSDPLEKDAVALPGDLAHIVTALAVTTSTLLALRALTPLSGIWADGREGTPAADDPFANLNLVLQAWDGDAEEEAPAPPPPPAWGPALWQGLRVLLEQLQGTAADQRHLHRSGTLPSLIASLFLQPTFPEPVEAAQPQPGDVLGVPAAGSAAYVASDAGSSPPAASPRSSCSEDEDGRRPGHGADPETPESALQGLYMAAQRDAGQHQLVEGLLHSVLVELVIERLVVLLAGIRRKSSVAVTQSSHWITAWYESLLFSMRSFVRSHLRGHVLWSAAEAAQSSDRWAAAMCAPDAALNDVLGQLGGGQLFLALWRQLNGTRRLQILFSHHPRLSFAAEQLARSSAVLWKCGKGAPIQFLCVDHSGGPQRLVAHVRGLTLQVFLGHAARWPPGATGEEEDPRAHEAAARSGAARTEAYASGALDTSTAAAGWCPAFDPAAEMLLGRGMVGNAGVPWVDSEAKVLSLPDYGTDVLHFLSTLQGAKSTGYGNARGEGASSGDVATMLARPSPVTSLRHCPGPPTSLPPPAPARTAGLLAAQAHPWRPVYAVACEDSSVHLWAFGEAAPRCMLPRLPEQELRRRGAGATGGRPGAAGSGTGGGAGADGAAAAGGSVASQPSQEVSERVQQKCQLEWNFAGDRLLGVGSSSGVSLWTVGEGHGACQVCAVPTGAVHKKVTCGTFVSPGAVVATAGRRAEQESMGSGLKAWPYVAAGICVWDTLAPPSTALVAHDGRADARSHDMPAEYKCLAWEASVQRVFCGTKSGELRIFDLRQQRVSHRLEAHS